MLSQLAPPVNKQTSKLQRSVAKVPPSEDKKKDPNIPAKDHLPTRLGHLPQGSSSSDWQPSYHPWEQSLQPHCEPYPVTAVTWQEEWATSNLQVEEQEQLLWALSDRPASRYRKPPPAQPKPVVTVPRRTEREGVPKAQWEGPRLRHHCRYKKQRKTLRIGHGKRLLMSTCLRHGRGRTRKNVQCSRI